MNFDSDTTALLVVDMQYDFCNPDGALYAEGSEEVIKPVNDLMRTVHEHDVDIIFTQDTHNPDSPEFERWGEHCVEGTLGHDIDQRLDILPSTYPTIEKNTYDAFHETTLDSILEVQGIESVIICGTLANVCVQETATSANLHGYDVTVVEDAVGYITEEQRDAALEHIDWLCGDVVHSDDITFE